MHRALVALLLACPAALHAQEVAGVSSLLGPLVGHVAPDRALLWLRAAPSAREARVTVGREAPRTVPLEARGRGFFVLEVDGLAPDSPQELACAVEGGPSGTVAFRTPPLPGDRGKVRFGVGSCAGFAEQPVWDQVLAAKPDLFLWLGDNCYYRPRQGGPADWDSVEAMLRPQLRNRTLPAVLNVMRSMATYAVWDDHDYGPNNADGSWPLKAESRAVHRMLWANPAFGEDEEGVYFSFRRGPLEFFCLDGRWWKDVRPGTPHAKRRLYGPKQLAWLKRAIASSTAPLKVIAGGVQQIAGYPLAENWAEADHERRELLGWLEDQPGCDRVLFLSGDIHVCELYRFPRTKGRFTWELTSSGLAQENPYADMFELANRPEREWLTVSRGMFCLVEVDLPAGQPIEAGTLVFTCVGADGKTLAETRTTFESFGR